MEKKKLPKDVRGLKIKMESTIRECSLGFGCMKEEHEEWKEMCKVIQGIFKLTWGLSLVRLRLHQKEEHKEFNEDWLYKGAFS